MKDVMNAVCHKNKNQIKEEKNLLRPNQQLATQYIKKDDCNCFKFLTLTVCLLSFEDFHLTSLAPLLCSYTFMYVYARAWISYCYWISAWFIQQFAVHFKADIYSHTQYTKHNTALASYNEWREIGVDSSKF